MHRPGTQRQSAFRRIGPIVLLSAVAVGGALSTPAAQSEQAPLDLALFFQAGSQDEREARRALEAIAAGWYDGLTPMFIDMVRLMRGAEAGSVATIQPGGNEDDYGGASFGGLPGAVDVDPGSPVRRRLIRFLEKQTGQRFGDDLDRWRRWVWSRPYEPHPRYAAFKGAVYGNLDPSMRAFFVEGVGSKIRLDQIDWGGVGVNGIPALDHPTSVVAAKAGYLKDKHIVFGVVIDGQARAYPKRILAWHELARDELGGVPLTLVYCTLCGSVIPYDSDVAGRVLTFGTSGLLYRSNKLLFDAETNSLWSSIYGRPVVGPLVDFDVELKRYPVVTTTWGEWRALHPDTTVLSLPTEFKRDYSEGAAYRDYSRTDRLMFAVPDTDDRLKNKAEVLVLPYTVDAAERNAGAPLAIAASFLARNPVHQLSHGGKRIVIVTSPKGASRVYEIAADDRFLAGSDAGSLSDAGGRAWRVTEEALVGEQGERRPRIVAHRAFWFGWYAQYPDTELIR